MLESETSFWVAPAAAMYVTVLIIDLAVQIIEAIDQWRHRG